MRIKRLIYSDSKYGLDIYKMRDELFVLTQYGEIVYFGNPTEIKNKFNEIVNDTVKLEFLIAFITWLAMIFL